MLEMDWRAAETLGEKEPVMSVRVNRLEWMTIVDSSATRTIRRKLSRVLEQWLLSMLQTTSNAAVLRRT